MSTFWSENIKNYLLATPVLLVSFFWLTCGAPTGLNVMTVVPSPRQESCAAIDHTNFAEQVHKQRRHAYVNHPVLVNGATFGIYSGFAPEAGLTSEYVTIYVSGYAGACGNAPVKYRGAAIRAALQVMRYGGLQGPCVTFDFPTDVMQQFNFGQQGDQNCLERVLMAAKRVYPGKRIILYGDCRGATTILQLFARFVKHGLNVFDSVEALVLIAPSNSLKAVAHEMARARFGTWSLWGVYFMAFLEWSLEGITKARSA